MKYCCRLIECVCHTLSSTWYVEDNGQWKIDWWMAPSTTGSHTLIVLGCTKGQEEDGFINTLLWQKKKKKEKLLHRRWGQWSWENEHCRPVGKIELVSRFFLFFRLFLRVFVYSSQEEGVRGIFSWIDYHPDDGKKGDEGDIGTNTNTKADNDQ